MSEVRYAERFKDVWLPTGDMARAKNNLFYATFDGSKPHSYDGQQLAFRGAEPVGINIVNEAGTESANISEPSMAMYEGQHYVIRATEFDSDITMFSGAPGTDEMARTQLAEHFGAIRSGAGVTVLGFDFLNMGSGSDAPNEYLRKRLSKGSFLEFGEMGWEATEQYQEDRGKTLSDLGRIIMRYESAAGQGIGMLATAPPEAQITNLDLQSTAMFRGRMSMIGGFALASIGRNYYYELDGDFDKENNLGYTPRETDKAWRKRALYNVEKLMATNLLLKSIGQKSLPEQIVAAGPTRLSDVKIRVFSAENDHVAPPADGAKLVDYLSENGITAEHIVQKGEGHAITQSRRVAVGQTLQVLDLAA